VSGTSFALLVETSATMRSEPLGASQALIVVVGLEPAAGIYGSYFGRRSTQLQRARPLANAAAMFWPKRNELRLRCFLYVDRVAVKQY
jgi:hypothetical protein